MATCVYIAHEIKQKYSQNVGNEEPSTTLKLCKWLLYTI